MNRRRGRRRGPGSPLDRSYAQQAVLNPILAPCWTIFESILDSFWTKLVIFLGPIKLNLGTIFDLMNIAMSMSMSMDLSVLGLAECAKRLE